MFQNYPNPNYLINSYECQNLHHQLRVVWVGAKLMIVVHVNFKEFRLIIGGADGHRLHRLDFARRGIFILFK